MPEKQLPTSPYQCRRKCYELKAATEEERKNQHVAITPLGAICSICNGPVKDFEEKGK